MTIELLYGLIAAQGLLIAFCFFVISKLWKAIEVLERQSGLQKTLNDLYSERSKLLQKQMKDLIKYTRETNSSQNQMIKTNGDMIQKTGDFLLETAKHLQTYTAKPVFANLEKENETTH